MGACIRKKILCRHTLEYYIKELKLIIHKKTNMKKNLMMLILVLTGFMVKAQDTTIVIKSTAQCQECKDNIEKSLNFEKGVKSAVVNMDTKEVTVIYNPDKTTPEKIRTAISKTGYDADDVPADPKVYARLKPCCTKDGHKH
jgi:periplasmic mercuric ion binding protein